MTRMAVGRILSAALLAACLGAAPEAATTRTGWFADESCASNRVREGKTGPPGQTCTRRCIAKGVPVVFFDEKSGQLIRVQNPAATTGRECDRVQIRAALESGERRCAWSRFGCSKPTPRSAPRNDLRAPRRRVRPLALVAAPLAAEDAREVLKRQTQELVDAIASGSIAVWDKYLDPAVLYVDESGQVSTKKEMLEGLKPLPDGVSGAIAVTDFRVALHGDVAAATYVNDERETYHGHELHCQYRTTDTWTKTPDGWRLIASQALAMRTDPPAIALPAAALDAYCGRYDLASAISYEIRRNGDALEGQQTGRKAEALRVEAPDVLFVPGHPRYRYVFLRNAAGRITGFAQRREAWDLVWKRQS